MKTLVGVFPSRATAERAIEDLLDIKVPEDSITFLTLQPETPQATESHGIGKVMGSYVGGVLGGGAGLSMGVAAATLVVPGVGAVMAIGIAAAALLGLGGAGAGAIVGKVVDSGLNSPQPAHEAHEDAQLLRRLLKEGRSLVIVRTESAELAAAAGALLDRVSLGKPGLHGFSSTAAGLKVDSQQTGAHTVVTVAGRMTLREDGFLVKDAVRDAFNRGSTEVSLDLSKVSYIDSSGIGELVGALATARGQKGTLKLLNPSPAVQHILHVTRLSSVFDITEDNSTAVA